MKSSNHDFFSVLVLCTPFLACTSIPKVVAVGSIPTVARHIFQAFPVWIYTQSNITNMTISFNFTSTVQQQLNYQGPCQM